MDSLSNQNLESTVLNTIANSNSIASFIKDNIDNKGGK